MVFIYYIINYTIKSDCSQYQRVIAVGIVKKTFDDHNKDSTTASTNYIFTLDEFALKVFNQLSYDWEISKPLIASYLINLSDYYFPKINVKTINITLL